MFALILGLNKWAVPCVLKATVTLYVNNYFRKNDRGGIVLFFHTTPFVRVQSSPVA